MEIPTRPHRCANECGMCDHLDAEWAATGKPQDLNFPAYAPLREIVARAFEKVSAQPITYQPPILSEAAAAEYVRLLKE